MSKCKVIHEVPFDINTDILCLCASEVMKRHGKDGDIFIVFVSYDKMKKMNKDFFGSDDATDVLSFPSEKKIGYNEDKDNSYLGEIFICPEFLNKKNGDITWEVLHLVAHGTFHLLGIHHEHIEDGYDTIHKQEVEIIDYVMDKIK